MDNLPEINLAGITRTEYAVPRETRVHRRMPYGAFLWRREPPAWQPYIVSGGEEILLSPTPLPTSAGDALQLALFKIDELLERKETL